MSPSSSAPHAVHVELPAGSSVDDLMLQIDDWQEHEGRYRASTYKLLGVPYTVAVVVRGIERKTTYTYVGQTSEFEII